MFDTKTFPATPATSRLLLEFSRVNGMKISQDIRDLAEQDRISDEVLESAPFSPAKYSKRVIQRVLDWKGRALLLGNDPSIMLDYALLTRWLRGSERTLIICPKSHIALWSKRIRLLWDHPDIISSNPHKDSPWVITTSSELVNEDFLKNWSPDQLVVSETIDSHGLFGFRSGAGILTGLCREIPATMLLQLDSELPLTLEEYNKTGRQSYTLLNKIQEFLWSDLPAPHPLNGLNHSTGSYLRGRSYTSQRITDLMGLFGAYVVIQDN